MVKSSDTIRQSDAVTVERAFIMPKEVLYFRNSACYYLIDSFF